jgi:outer membrane protein OmpA-like peptidoglycan-associated protein
VHISKGNKSFFANRNIYLSNKRNTIIKKTKTNNLGAFSFSEIKPDQDYFVGVDAEEIQKGDKLDVLNKDDQFVFSLDTLAGKRISKNFNASNNEKHNALSVSESEMRMSVDAKLYGDNTSNPLGKIKIILLNDAYEVIDSTVTDDLGLFKFKYLPYLKRFFLSAENDKNQLDLFKNILMYSSDDNLIKVMTHVKGTKFVYKPLDAEIKRMQELILEDPWLELDLDKKHTAKNKIIIEPILFDTKQFSLLPTAKETLEKIAMVLKNNTSIKIEISAHTDSKGNDQDNLKLSEQRAKSVTDFLIQNGINSSRLISKGFGETKILNRCKNGIDCSDLEHAINRRVEFKILAN